MEDGEEEEERYSADVWRNAKTNEEIVDNARHRLIPSGCWMVTFGGYILTFCAAFIYKLSLKKETQDEKQAKSLQKDAFSNHMTEFDLKCWPTFWVWPEVMPSPYVVKYIEPNTTDLP